MSQAAKGPCGAFVQITKGFLRLRGVGVALKSYITAQSEQLSPLGLGKAAAQVGMPFSLVWGPVTATPHGTARVIVTCGLQPGGILGAVPEAKLCGHITQAPAGLGQSGGRSDTRPQGSPAAKRGRDEPPEHAPACVRTQTSRVFVHGQNAHVAPAPSTPPGARTPQHRLGAYERVLMT